MCTWKQNLAMHWTWPFPVIILRVYTTFFMEMNGILKLISLYCLLRSVVGKTDDLRSDLWWTIPLHILLDCFGIPLGFQPIKSALARQSGVQVPVISRHDGHMVILDQSQSWYFPGSSWVVLWLLFCRSAPSTFPVTWSTLKGPFRGVPSR